MDVRLLMTNFKDNTSNFRPFHFIHFITKWLIEELWLGIVEPMLTINFAQSSCYNCNSDIHLYNWNLLPSSWELCAVMSGVWSLVVEREIL